MYNRCLSYRCQAHVEGDMVAVVTCGCQGPLCRLLDLLH